MYILDCMVIAVQASIGMLFWGMLSCLFGFLIILYQQQKRKTPKIYVDVYEKGKYKGQKILIQGGKKDD